MSVHGKYLSKLNMRGHYNKNSSQNNYLSVHVFLLESRKNYYTELIAVSQMYGWEPKIWYMFRRLEAKLLIYI